jgi:biopolymer transport protein ExbB
MKHLHIALFVVLSFVSGAFAQNATAPATALDTVGALSRSASEELAKSTRELAQLHEQIDAEKLPLSKKLNDLEDQLAKLRAKQAEVSRQADRSNLDSTNIKSEMKIHQDTLTYINNLLDEYARTFDTKVNPVEMQYCSAPAEAAKQAMSNNALTVAEKFTKQLTFVTFSSKRLSDVIGGMRFPGEGVDQAGAVAKGNFAIIGPIAVFSDSTGTVAGLALPQANSPRPLIRPLEASLQPGIVALAAGEDGAVPLDPSRGAALKALVQRTSLLHIFNKGGPIMYPLLLLSIISLGVVLERLTFLFFQRIQREPKALDAFFVAVTKGDHEEAIRIGAKSPFYVVRALVYALKHKEQSLANALIYSQAQELKKFRRGIPVLDTVITLAPLLGLLATVTGMMGSFSLIGGDLSAPGAITGGIAEALIGTAFGLGIAITSLIPFNFLNARHDDARHEIESAATQLELLVHPGEPPKSANNHPEKAEPAIPTGLKIVNAVMSAATGNAKPAQDKE